MKAYLAALLLLLSSVVAAEQPCYAPTFRTDANLLIISCVGILTDVGTRLYDYQRVTDIELHFIWNPDTMAMEYIPEYPRETLKR